jgi:hypothetical protein
VLDFELLVEAATLLRRPALAGDHELAAADLERDVGGIYRGEVDLHNRSRRLVGVVDVHPRGEAAPP